jgi:hypothetical protein
MAQSAAILTRPLDAVRLALLRSLGSWAKPFVRDRSLRVSLFAVLACGTAFLGTIAAPLVMLAWTPLILGVPHLLGDVRYLVVRPGLHRRPELLIPICLTLGAIVLWAPVSVSLAATAAAVLLSRASLLRRAQGLLVVALCAAWCARHPLAAPLVVAHLHNLVAIVIWWCWRRRAFGEWVGPVLFVAGLVALLLGLGDSPAFTHPLLGVHHGRWAQELARLAPGLPSPFDLRLVLAFAYAQSFHYAAWIRLIPEDDRPRPTPRTFAASWRALKDDFGLAPLLLVAAVALALVLWGVLDLTGARTGYLRLALFHGPLELAVIGSAWTERRRLTEGLPG